MTPGQPAPAFTPSHAPSQASDDLIQSRPFRVNGLLVEPRTPEALARVLESCRQRVA